mmetsp:Transcript_42414/g.112264  ORF Transcript_42414/g.112264 Transcript_42414/m.112264 type:complete len:712 (-) Transcript_42414:74-2209(-)
MSTATQQAADGEAKPMVSSDLEGQGAGAAQYGAVEPVKGGAAKSAWPEGGSDAGRLFRGIVGTYAVLFAINFICDFAYLLTMDGRFPRAMGMDGIAYPSESERQATISYTRHMTVIGMTGSLVRFCALASIIYFQLFWKADVLLHQAFSYLEEQRMACVEGCSGSMLGRFFLSALYFCTAPFRFCAFVCGKCVSCCCSGCLANHDWRQLLHGSAFLALFGTGFMLLSTPFAYWALTLELEYGFANALSVTKAAFLESMGDRIMGALIWSIPSTFMFLALLQFKYGWLLMWAGTTAMMTFVQFNMATLAPLLMGMNNVFPNDVFAVGRGFGLAGTESQETPWISLNRIYFRDMMSTTDFSTHDRSKGMLALKLNRTSGSWVIADKLLPHDSSKGAKVYAQVLAPVSADNKLSLDHPDGMLNILNETPWPDLGRTGHVGVRLGDKLRGKLFGFARTNNISISQIYMVDGSHQDARANAFAGGATDSIIGLYDTLFLGDHAKDTAQDRRGAVTVQKLESGESAIQFLSDEVQGLDVEDEVRAGVWNSAPTQAMSDDEIVAILGHELAHAALGHLHETTWRQALTSFVTFAALGWAAHSPQLAAAFMLPAPTLHIGYSLYQYVVGPPLQKVVKFVSDARIRYNEYEADAFVARMSPRYGTALQTGLSKLSINTNQDPNAPSWYEALHYDHPTVSHRFDHIEAVMAEEEKAKRLVK